MAVIGNLGGGSASIPTQIVHIIVNTNFIVPADSFAKVSGSGSEVSGAGAGTVTRIVITGGFNYPLAQTYVEAGVISHTSNSVTNIYVDEGDTITHQGSSLFSISSVSIAVFSNVP